MWPLILALAISPDPKCIEPDRYEVTCSDVRDTTTGLTWQRAPEGPMSWTEARDYCAAAGGRLPTVAELAAIVFKPGGLNAGRPQYCDPAIDQFAFPSTPSDFFWTATADLERDMTTVINFFDGRHPHASPEEGRAYARCVRGGDVP